ncbi:hypothetical protein Hanom_Chr02g00138411 [Helianthus anomalus]
MDPFNGVLITRQRQPLVEFLDVECISLENENTVQWITVCTDGPCGWPRFWIWSIAFQKYADDSCGFHFVTHLVPNFCKKYIDGPYGLHSITHLAPNLDVLKPLDLLAGD